MQPLSIRVSGLISGLVDLADDLNRNVGRFQHPGGALGGIQGEAQS